MGQGAGENSRVHISLDLASHVRELRLYPKPNGVIEVYYGLLVVCPRKTPAFSASRPPAKQPLDSSLRGGVFGGLS